MNGDSLWTKTFGGTEWEYGNSVQTTSDGGFIVAGYTWSFGAGLIDMYLVRTDSDGNTIWTETYGGSHHDAAHSVYQCMDGGFVITGETETYGAGEADVFLVRTNSSGDFQWSKTFGGVRDDRGQSVIQTSDGKYVVGGYTSSFGNNDANFYLICLDKD